MRPGIVGTEGLQPPVGGLSQRCSAQGALPEGWFLFPEEGRCPRGGSRCGWKCTQRVGQAAAPQPTARPWPAPGPHAAAGAWRLRLASLRAHGVGELGLRPVAMAPPVGVCPGAPASALCPEPPLSSGPLPAMSTPGCCLPGPRAQRSLPAPPLGAAGCWWEPRVLSRTCGRPAVQDTEQAERDPGARRSTCTPAPAATLTLAPAPALRQRGHSRDCPSPLGLAPAASSHVAGGWSVSPFGELSPPPPRVSSLCLCPDGGGGPGTRGRAVLTALCLFLGVASMLDRCHCPPRWACRGLPLCCFPLARAPDHPSRGQQPNLGPTASRARDRDRAAHSTLRPGPAWAEAWGQQRGVPGWVESAWAAGAPRLPGGGCRRVDLCVPDCTWPWTSQTSPALQNQVRMPGPGPPRLGRWAGGRRDLWAWHLPSPASALPVEPGSRGSFPPGGAAYSGSEGAASSQEPGPSPGWTPEPGAQPPGRARQLWALGLWDPALHLSSAGDTGI